MTLPTPPRTTEQPGAVKAEEVTGKEVFEAVKAAGLTYIPHHECGCCGSMVSYTVESERLYFNPACDCTTYSSPPEPCQWQDAADWINMQQTDAARNMVRAKFGMPPLADGASERGTTG